MLWAIVLDGAEGQRGPTEAVNRPGIETRGGSLVRSGGHACRTGRAVDIQKGTSALIAGASVGEHVFE